MDGDVPPPPTRPCHCAVAATSRPRSAPPTLCSPSLNFHVICRKEKPGLCASAKKASKNLHQHCPRHKNSPRHKAPAEQRCPKNIRRLGAAKSHTKAPHRCGAKKGAARANCSHQGGPRMEGQRRHRGSGVLPLAARSEFTANKAEDASLGAFLPSPYPPRAA